MTTVEVFAPAKINLTLHVTGQREDGYHLLDSLVCFAHVGDRLTVSPAPSNQLTVTGRYAGAVPTGDDNLIWKAAGLLNGAFDVMLEKNLPVASGIGGGSADAAAALSAMTSVMNYPMPGLEAQLSLGADVPVCVMGGLVRMRGIGDQLEPLDTGAFPWPMVLVNPGVPVSTPAVFRSLASKTNAPMASPFELGPSPSQMDGFIDWLAQQRNDLEAPAKELVPEVGDVLDRLQAQSGCLLARMSGSGATCFGIFAEDDAARSAAQALSAEQPDWWVAPSIGPGF